MPLVKAIIAALIIGVFAFEIFRKHTNVRYRGLIAFAAAICGYELLNRQNFGSVVFLIVIGFAVYAWVNWFVSLCALMVLMAFLNNADTPHGIAGIQGLNPWNLLMANVLLSWLLYRRRQGLQWDAPRYVKFLAFGLLFVVIWSYSRMLDDYQKLNVFNDSEDLKKAGYNFAWVTSEYLIDCLKWVLPGIIFYDACRARNRIAIALSFVLLLYFLIGIQVVKAMPLRAVTATASELGRISARDLRNNVGYFRTELSMMLSGASWAILSCVVFVRRRKFQVLLIVAVGVVALGQALTGGRSGYVTWGLTGLIVCILRWRRLLPVIPAAVLAIVVFMPAVMDRMLTGFGGEHGGVQTQTDLMAVSAGRVIAWSYVIPKIEQSPIIGYGRQAMVRENIYQQILADTDGEESFPHPHNAYLEMLLDNGVFGFLLAMPLYFVLLFHSFSLLMDRSDPLFGAVGGTACCLILGLMIAALTSETFYPQDSACGMWAAAGITLRVYMERKRSRETGEPLFGEYESDELINMEEEPDLNFSPVG